MGPLRGGSRTVPEAKTRLIEEVPMLERVLEATRQVFHAFAENPRASPPPRRGR